MTVSKRYRLRRPLLLKDIVYNDMGEPPEYLFGAEDGCEHELVTVGGDYVQMLFTPCEVVDDDLHQQIRELVEKKIHDAVVLGAVAEANGYEKKSRELAKPESDYLISAFKATQIPIGF